MLYRKLKSCNGASLTVALLLFMVCAVVGIVVLTAATAAGGRAKDLTEVDRSYYNVASAVSLLSNELCGEDNKVEIKRIIREKPSVDEEPYETTIGGFSIYELRHKLGYLHEIPEDWSFLTWMAACLLFDESADDESNIYCNIIDEENKKKNTINYSFDDGVADKNDITWGSFFLRHSSSNPSYDHIPDIECKYRLKKDGVLLLEVTDNTPVLGLKNYTLTLKLTPEFKDTGIRTNSDKGLTQRTSTVTWKVDSVS